MRYTHLSPTGETRAEQHAAGRALERARVAAILATLSQPKPRRPKARRVRVACAA